MHPTTSASVRVTTPTTGTAHTLKSEAVNTTTNEAQAFALLQATSDASLAAFYLRRGDVKAARRKAIRLLKALQGLSKFECAQASASPCTGCPDNFPLPDGPLDFFDTQVVADYVSRRTACTLCPAAQKPCLKGGAA